MKRVLGLDLGSSSIGWAIIEENSAEVLSEGTLPQEDRIMAIGSRVIPLSTDESTKFSAGQAITTNAERRAKRTQRKGLDRYQLRRAALIKKLQELGMYGPEPLKLSTLELWGLRARAVSEKVSLYELGRVLRHINQKRGYRTVKSDFGDKKLGAYVEQVVGRYRELHEKGLTIGQFMYKELLADPAFRCKDRVYPRDAYVEEFDLVMACQKRYYPELLSDEVIDHLRNKIIYHQRPLKSCKHLVAKCELERHDAPVGDRIRNHGPKVAPRSSPLFQVSKIWESINNLQVQSRKRDIHQEDDTLYITPEQKLLLFNYLNTNDKLKATKFYSLLKLKPKEWLAGKSFGAGLQGNTTYCAIEKALGNYPQKEELLRFDLKITDGAMVNTQTGELSRVIDPSFEQEPLYQLWHVLYSISNIEELRHALQTRFGIEDKEVLEALCQIDFVKAGYSNKSSRAIRKLLPYLMEGMQYYEAKLAAGYDDRTLTKEENEARVLAERLMPIAKGELRQPVVEKILNQLVNLVNALMEEYGHFDEIRVELARELKQSQEERKEATDHMRKNNSINESYAKLIQEYQLTPTRSRIQKYKMWEESGKTCVYCGETVNVKEFLLGSGVEIEHIIPRSVLFDDSFSNKVCSCRRCNKEKNNRTAYDFMESRGEGELKAYVERINEWAEKGKISKTKRNKLLMKGTEIPSDFIERQLRESQYIAKKAKEMLQQVCRNVYSTSGSVTDFIRHIWGWDEVLHTLNFERYRTAGLTEMVEREVDGRKVEVERIKDWSKRMDHRHHAVDALTIACTKQGYIQRINNLNSLKEVSFKSLMDEEQGEKTRQRLTRLERYIKMQPHFSTAEVAQAIERIAVSFKSGKRAAGVGKRYIHKGGKRICVQKGIIVPRGALSEESIYGRIHHSETGKEEYVIKYKVGKISLKDVESVVDKRIREILRERLLQHDGKHEKAFAEPVLDHQGREIRSVRCRTGLSAVVPLRCNAKGEEIAFVKPGNNHHIAIYEDEKGGWQEHVATFWHAVERKKYGLPAIIQNPAEAWDKVTDRMPESFQKLLPASATWRFKFAMQQNEMFILGMEEELYQEAMAQKNYALLSRYLYRVQKLSSGDYCFRHHIETTVNDDSKTAKEMGKMKRLRSIKSLFENNPHKVYISITGKISER